MKKTIILLSSLVSLVMFGQHHHEEGYYCAADEMRAEQERKYPEMKFKRLQIEKNLNEKGLEGVLRESGFSLSSPTIGELRTMSGGQGISASAWEAYNGTIYEIPVVVHIIESTNSADAHLKLTDDEVKTWIDNANKMFATTYSGYFSEGEGARGGNIIPFKLVLAKRNPNCEETTGIIRYDGSGLNGYNEYGMRNNDTNKGATLAQVRGLAPHWPEKHYYNIYVVTGLNENKRQGGLVGFAGFPENPDNEYDAVMKVDVVRRAGSSTLAHEMGHSFGLYHTFGRDGNGGTCPSPTENCATEGDKVCDTERSKSNFGQSPTDTDINECTGDVYQGVQYNIMNYTNVPRKFTAGQRDRVLATFLPLRGSLVRSLGATPVDGAKKVELTASSCTPGTDNPTANYGIGIKRLQLGDIDVSSEGFGMTNYNAYTDHTKICIEKSNTNLVEGKEVSLTLTKGLNNSRISVWIDYNDNGQFEDSERVIHSPMNVETQIFKFTPSTSAIKEKYLRMRVRSDWNYRAACGNAQFGEAEDYAVRIVPENWVDPATQTNNSTDGRVGINTEEPKATLDVRETTEVPETQPQGVLFPNFTTEQRATFQDVAEGTMIFNTTLKCLEIYSNGAWKCLN